MGNLTEVVYLVRWARDASGAQILKLMGWGPDGWREGVVLSAPVARAASRKACALAKTAQPPTGWEWTDHCNGPWLWAGRPTRRSRQRLAVA